jgi:hypothetical protein
MYDWQIIKRTIINSAMLQKYGVMGHMMPNYDRQFHYICPFKRKAEAATWGSERE